MYNFSYYSEKNSNNKFFKEIEISSFLENFKNFSEFGQKNFESVKNGNIFNKRRMSGVPSNVLRENLIELNKNRDIEQQENNRINLIPEEERIFSVEDFF